MAGSQFQTPSRDDLVPESSAENEGGYDGADDTPTCIVTVGRLCNFGVGIIFDNSGVGHNAVTVAFTNPGIPRISPGILIFCYILL